MAIASSFLMDEIAELLQNVRMLLLIWKKLYISIVVNNFIIVVKTTLYIAQNNQNSIKPLNGKYSFATSTVIPNDPSNYFEVATFHLKNFSDLILSILVLKIISKQHIEWEIQWH